METQTSADGSRNNGKQRKAPVIVGLVLVPVLGVIDYLTGQDLSFSIFYVASVYLAAWFGGAWLGVAAALASSLAWLAAEAAGNTDYPHAGFVVWNMTVRLGFFLIITVVLLRLKKAMKREMHRAREDFLTGVSNRRHFLDLMKAEIQRVLRYGSPMTVAYMDLDNFKELNDSLGHAEGDDVLVAVARNLKKHTRKTDLVARYGGDEFVVLMPETGPDAARTAVEKMRTGLMDAMKRSSRPITFSIGVITSVWPPDDPDAVIRAADALMYGVKQEGKNMVDYGTMDGRSVVYAKVQESNAALKGQEEKADKRPAV